MDKLPCLGALGLMGVVVVDFGWGVGVLMRRSASHVSRGLYCSRVVDSLVGVGSCVRCVISSPTSHSSRWNREASGLLAVVQMEMVWRVIASRKRDPSLRCACYCLASSFRLPDSCSRCCLYCDYSHRMEIRVQTVHSVNVVEFRNSCSDFRVADGPSCFQQRHCRVWRCRRLALVYDLVGGRVKRRVDLDSRVHLHSR